MNVSKIVNDYLLANIIDEVNIIYNDVFPKDEGLCVISRYDPSTAKEIEYIDGSSVGSQQLGYYVRSSNASECRTILEKIFNAVDNLHLEGVNNITIDIEVLTQISFVGIDDKEQNIYTFDIKVSYDKANSKI
ncbi:MAG: minor capsid protein [Treponema sp.]|nr:minor capsid protein [Treponema sp.]